MKHSKFLNGVVVGIAIGMLFAPNKGKDTRKKISGYKGKVEDWVAAAGDSLQGLKNDAESIIKSGKAKVEDWRNPVS